MKLEIQSLWSPDLSPPSKGLPPDIEDFEVLIQVSIGEIGRTGGEVFSFSVASPSQLARYEAGRFITGTLVLDKFSWSAIEGRLQKLLSFADSAANWQEVIESFQGILQYAD